MAAGNLRWCCRVTLVDRQNDVSCQERPCNPDKVTAGTLEQPFIHCTKPALWNTHTGSLFLLLSSRWPFSLARQPLLLSHHTTSALTHSFALCFIDFPLKWCFLLQPPAFHFQRGHHQMLLSYFQQTSWGICLLSVKMTLWFLFPLSFTQVSPDSYNKYGLIIFFRKKKSKFNRNVCCLAFVIKRLLLPK